jgi:hypothetical protein
MAMAEVRVRLSAVALAVAAVLAAGPVTGATGAPAQDSRRERSTFAWSHDGERIEISHEGAVEFTEDDKDVKSLAPGGHFRISTGSWFGRGVDIRADSSGILSRRYRVSIVEKPYEPEGREWLAQTLPRFIRESGIGAPARVARFMKQGGPATVLAEISRIESSHGKRVYFAALFKGGELDGATARQALMQAAREIRSDYDMASLLVDVQHLAAASVTRKAYFDAASTIQSDYEMRRALSEGLKNGRVEPPVLAEVLAAAASIDSDYELATLLVQVARLQPLDATTRRPFFAALSGVGGAYEHARVLGTMADRSDLSDDVLVDMLRSSARVGSDYELAQFLVKIAKAHGLDGDARPAFFMAVEQIRSSYEKARVLEMAARRPGAPAETVVALLRAAATIDGHHERSQVLQAVAANHAVTGTAREAYLQAAERLGEYEQGKALSALVRSERLRK